MSKRRSLLTFHFVVARILFRRACLKEMFEDVDESIMQFVENYKVQLIVPNEIQDFDKFTTDFGKVIKYIAVSEDEEALAQLLEDEAFRSVGTDAVRLLNVCTKSNISINEGEEKVDMCSGLKALIEEGREEGVVLGENNKLRQLVEKKAKNRIINCTLNENPLY